MLQSMQTHNPLFCTFGRQELHDYSNTEMLRKKDKAMYTTQLKDKATQHTQGSHFFQRKMSCLRWDLNPRHSMNALPTELPKQLSWLLHIQSKASQPDKQVNSKLNMKDPTGVTNHQKCCKLSVSMITLTQRCLERKTRQCTQHNSKQHNTPKAVILKLSCRVLGRMLYQLSYRGSSAGTYKAKHLNLINLREASRL